MRHPTLEEYIANKCIHFNGIDNNVCKAGITYKKWNGDLPCFKDKKIGVCVCCTWSTEENAHTINLTKREKQILPLIIQGLTNGAIGRSLYITKGTVIQHVCRIYKKIRECYGDLNENCTREEFIAYAIKKGLGEASVSCSPCKKQKIL